MGDRRDFIAKRDAALNKRKTLSAQARIVIHSCFSMLESAAVPSPFCVTVSELRYHKHLVINYAVLNLGMYVSRLPSVAFKILSFAL